jgi:hypothetical protein
MEMGLGGKWLIATAVGAALIVPAVVLASGGPSGSFDTGITNAGGKLKFSSSGGTVETQGNRFRIIPGMTLPNPTEFYKLPVTVQISADMTAGKAKFRVISDVSLGPSRAPLTPGSATFSAPGSNSFQFVEPGTSSETASDYDVQWKRVGSHPAKAADVVMTLFGAPD